MVVARSTLPEVPVVFDEFDEEFDDFEDDDVEFVESSGEPEPVNCPVCDVRVTKNDILHPVMTGVNANTNVVVFFHDACYRTLSPLQLEIKMKDLRYETWLSSLEEDEIGKC
jgi:hypothetical protein